MTRYTNIGIKRTFIQAGFSNEGGAGSSSPAVPSEGPPEALEGPVSTNPSVTGKKRKRNKKSVPDASADGESEQAGNGHETCGKPKGKKFDKPNLPSKRVNAAGYLKRKQRDDNQSATEQRRLKRIDERQANTICFACREKGHAARDCPTVNERLEGQGEDLDGEGERKRPKRVTPLTGICYRCGSARHSLSRCRIPEDPSNPLPFASCFVCSGKGHLASKCPQNKSKGVYPNGGSCKLCGETSHLARDCELRKQEKIRGSVILGTGEVAGADEDDFHSLKRTNAQIDQEERTALKLSKKLAKSAASTDPRESLKMSAGKKIVVF